jgi:hypothetical protein
VFSELRIRAELTDQLRQEAANLKHRMYALLGHLELVGIVKHATIFEKGQRPASGDNFWLREIPGHPEDGNTEARDTVHNLLEFYSIFAPFSSSRHLTRR